VLAGALTQAKLKQELPDLTQREREVLRLLADGHSNEEIGKQLFISPETVRTHIRKAMEKLDADTRTQAVATALRQSLIS
jgi:RNA polymerase sigma factor (sigma-70 family)